jgi:hypothetical protein
MLIKGLRTRFAAAATVLITVLALSPISGQAGESGVSGIWQGTVIMPGTGDMQLKVITRQSGESFSGSISIPSDNLNIPIDRGEYDADEGYLLLSGISKVTTPDGSTPRIRFVFQGFLDNGGTAWNGDWYMASVDDEEQPLAGDSFSLRKRGRTASSDSKPPSGGTSGLISVPQGKAGTDSAKIQTNGTGGDAPDMSGTWKGEKTNSGDSSSATVLMTLTRSGDSYSGKIVGADVGWDENEASINSGGMRNGRFELTGSMSMASQEDNETYVVDIALSGPVKKDVWNAVFTVKYEGNVVGTEKVRFTRMNAGTDNPDKPASAPKTGGMSGKGKQ